MSCLNCHSMDLGTNRSYHLDTSNSKSRYINVSHSPHVRSPCSEMYTSGSYTTAGWITPLSMDYSRSTSGTDTSGFSTDSRMDRNAINCRGDQPFSSEGNVQMRKIASESTHDSSRSRRESIVATPSFENIKARLKLLEGKNSAMRDDYRKLLTENESFKCCLEHEKSRNTELERNLAELKTKLFDQKKMVTDKSTEPEDTETKIAVRAERGTSTTDIVKTEERAIQNWSLCKGCQNKLENSMNGVPTVTVTRSELDILEKDMQSLRDAMIAREEAWEKAMERERTYRQQILRLTCEAITNRHIQETRDEEIRVVKDSLKERECDVKSLQKRENALSKIVTKLYRHQRDIEGNNLGNVNAFLEITEKEQRYIDECLKQVSAMRGKQKTKTRCINAIERNTSVESQRTSPRNVCNKSTIHGRD